MTNLFCFRLKVTVLEPGAKAAVPMTFTDYLDPLVAALMLAGIYAAMSVGMTVIYGVMKVVNLAHAGLMMLGAYFASELFERFHIDPLLGAVLALPVFFLFG